MNLPVKKDKKKRFNTVDIVLTVLIVACLAVLAYLIFFTSGKPFPKKAETHVGSVELRVDRVLNAVADKVSAGDVVFFGSGQEKLGTVKSVSVSPYKESTGSADDKGILLYTDSEEYSTVYIVISCEISEKDGLKSVGDFVIRIGEGLTIRTKNYALDCVCTGFVSE